MIPEMWAKKCQAYIHNAPSCIVFLFLDFLEASFCVVHKGLDKLLEGKSSPCYCGKQGSKIITRRDANDDEISESLYGRTNVFSKIIFLLFPRIWDNSIRIKHVIGNTQMHHRWSDCKCESCLSWMKHGGEKLHVVIKEPSVGSIDKPIENVIFFHGAVSSASFWTESVFQNLSETEKHSYRLFAVDLLGFGSSPKPMNCLYTVQDHLEMTEKSVITPYKLESFHLVAHSMGCIIALAMAPKYSKFIKSVTLVAPAFFPGSKDGTGLEVLKTMAAKKLWPPKTFLLSVVSRYEHLGRCCCYLLCRHHVTWEGLLKLLTGRDNSFVVKDLSKHTHHSLWHNIHNVACGSAKFRDGYFEILKHSRVKISIIHGDRDKIIPIEYSYNIKKKIPHAELNIIPYAGHNSVIFGRKKEFTQNLQHFWASSCLRSSL